MTTPVDLFRLLVGSSLQGMLLTLGSWLLVVVAANIIHECGHVVGARFCGVSLVGLRIGQGPAWVRGTFKGCVVVFGLVPVGGNVTYGPGIAVISRLKRAVVAAGGASAELSIGGVASLFAVFGPGYQWLWFAVWWTAFSGLFAISPLHSDGRKVWFGV